MVSVEIPFTAASSLPSFSLEAVPPVAWVEDAVAKFKARMLDETQRFPCIFGVDAVRRGTLRLAAVPAGPERVERLADALRSFLPSCRDLGNRTSLVVFFEPDQRLATVQDYQDHFWSLLQGLHDLDELAWPDDIAADTASSKWEFSFHGEPMFVVANTPLHTRRLSRQFDYFAVTFQPRFVFEGLEEESDQGVRARRIIRKRLSEYDHSVLAPTLGSFGADGNREWSQYFLDDSDAGFDTGTGCPFSMRDRDDRSAS